MHEVIESFIEKNHDGRTYTKGDVYPADGYKATKKRITELRGKENKYKRPFLGDEIKASEGK